MFSLYADQPRDFVRRDDPAFNTELPSAKRFFTGDNSRDQWAVADGQSESCTRYGVRELSDAENRAIIAADDTKAALWHAGHLCLITVNGKPIDADKPLAARALLSLGFLVFERANRPLEFAATA